MNKNLEEQEQEEQEAGAKEEKAEYASANQGQRMAATAIDKLSSYLQVQNEQGVFTDETEGEKAEFEKLLKEALMENTSLALKALESRKVTGGMEPPKERKKF